MPYTNIDIYRLFILPNTIIKIVKHIFRLAKNCPFKLIFCDIYLKCISRRA